MLKKKYLNIFESGFCKRWKMRFDLQYFLFFDIIKQRNHKYATPPPWKQFYVFLATAPTGVLTAGTAWLLSKSNLWERCCTFMEKRRRCTIAGITVHEHFFDLQACVKKYVEIWIEILLFCAFYVFSFERRGSELIYKLLVVLVKQFKRKLKRRKVQ